MKTLIDNGASNKMGDAVAGILSRQREFNGKPVQEVCVATGYFNPQGFIRLAEELSHVPKVRLLIGAEPKPEALKAGRVPGDPQEPEFTRALLRKALGELEDGLARDRDFLEFSPATSSLVADTIRHLRAGNIEVRRYEREFLHAKAYLFRGIPTPGLMVGSSNLTHAGLYWNKELNMGAHGNEVVSMGEEWFDALWESSVPYDLAGIYEKSGILVPPRMIYLKVLDLLYGGEVEEEKHAAGSVQLTAFQSHGVWRAMKIIESYRGVIVADEVGLGKTFTAGAIMERYRARRQKVLLICPAALRDTTWKTFIGSNQMGVECVGYEQLAQDRRLGGDTRTLMSDPDDYSLVVVDEAHNYRNPEARTRARVLRTLLQGRPKDLVLLSATPVNNSLWDIYHLIRFFMKQDAALSHRGVFSVRGTFAAAAKQDPYSLSPDVLFPIIDATTVKRTRAFVRKHYENDSIPDGKGGMAKIIFPTPRAITLRYSLEKALPGIFPKIEAALAPSGDAEPGLKLARYKYESYKKNSLGEIDEGRRAMLGLIRTGLLKRFESSPKAFVMTVEKMISEHRAFLSAAKAGKIIATNIVRELAGADDEQDFDTLLDAAEGERSKDYNMARLSRDIESDIEVLEDLVSRVKKVAGKKDPKFECLCNALSDISAEADAESLDSADARQKRKVLVFSYFADTVNDLEEKLRKAIETDPRLATYRTRLASATSADYRHGVSRDDAVGGFAPLTTKLGLEDRFDLLLATDVLSEGQNLQQARHIINYDLPWNPMRLVQRHGRIDRIGSAHREIFLRTIFPDDRLNDLLNLEERVRKKLAHAAASVGLGHSPIETGSEGTQSFTETREEIEKLYDQDATIYERGGTASASQTGEEYRQILRGALDAMSSEIRHLPWRSGSILERDSCIPGWFFCAKVGSRIYLRFVPRSNLPEAPLGESIPEPGFCLRQIENDISEAPSSETLDISVVYQAWLSARKSILKSWDHESDPKSFQHKSRPANRAAADFLRQNSEGIDSNRRKQALDILESPWPHREEMLLKHWLSEKISAVDLVDEVLNVGIEPPIPVDPLPPAQESDIMLVCWMEIRKTKEYGNNVS